MNSPNGRRALVTLLGLILAGCSSHRHHDNRDQVIYSPNGEPLSGGPLGHPTCAVALGHWLDRVDSNHDGFIDRREYLADATRQFHVMDLDKTGILSPDELARYRAPFGGDVGSSHSGEDSGAALAAADDRPDPVMAADSKARFEVSLSDFLAYQGEYFAALPGGQSDHVARTAFTSSCAADGS